MSENIEVKNKNRGLLIVVRWLYIVSAISIAFLIVANILGSVDYGVNRFTSTVDVILMSGLFIMLVIMFSSTFLKKKGNKIIISSLTVFIFVLVIYDLFLMIGFYKLFLEFNPEIMKLIMFALSDNWLWIIGMVSICAFCVLYWRLLSIDISKTEDSFMKKLLDKMKENRL